MYPFFSFLFSLALVSPPSHFLLRLLCADPSAVCKPFSLLFVVASLPTWGPLMDLLTLFYNLHISVFLYFQGTEGVLHCSDCKAHRDIVICDFGGIYCK